MGSIRTGLLLLLTACGGAAQPAVNVDAQQSPPPEPTKVATPSTASPPPVEKGDYASKLAEARKIRAEIIATPSPKAPRPATKEKSVRFVQTEVKAWYEDMKPRVESGQSTYAAAHKAATSTSERAVALGEVGDVDTLFVERFLAVGLSAMPDEWRKDVDISTAYKDSLYGAVAGNLTRAKNVVSLCDQTAPGDAKCKAVGARIEVIEKTAPLPPP